MIETGWWAVPFSAIYTSPELRAYREWLSPNNAAMRMSLGGSFYSPNVEDYYATPWDIGLGHLVKFDHDFIGRAALERMAGKPHRRKVTLVWNAEDVLGVFRRLLEGGETAMHIDLPLSATSRLHYDKVLSTDGKIDRLGALSRLHRQRAGDDVARQRRGGVQQAGHGGRAGVG